MKSWRDALSPLWPEKQRVRDLPDPGGAGGGTDVELQETVDAMGREFAAASAPPYVPPLPVPLARPVQRPEGQRGESSEVWLVNPPAAVPGLGVLVAGGAAEKGSQFPINSIRIDNLTSQWIYFPEIGAWVPPFWYGRVIRYDGSRVQRVRFETPGGVTALAASTTLVARVVFSEEYWDEQSGGSMASNLAPTTTGAPNAGVTIFDDASGLPAEVQNPADALPNQAGLVTVSLNEGWNGATWDRVRAGADNADGIAALGLGISRGAAEQFGWAGTTGWIRVRVPNIFKNLAGVVVNAGSITTVWTPAAGLKARLMGWVVDGNSSLVDAPVTFFETSTTGTFMGTTGFIAGSGAPSYVSFLGGGPIVSTSSALIVAFSTNAVTLWGTLFGVEE